MEESASAPRISIVVPIYKVEKYLRDCVESVLAQRFTDFELILVDDGSPDKCGEICDELAKKDSRIRVFHQQNGGVTSARRLGVEQARGEWITFVDPDDLLPKDSLKDLLAEASDNTDWVQGWEQRFNDGGTPIAETRTGKVTSFDLAGLVENMMFCHPGPVGKLVRRKLFTPYVMAVPREIRFAQDTLMNIRLIANGPRQPKEIDKVVYLYRRGVSSSTTASHLRAESYIFRYTKLLLPELRKISTPSNKDQLSHLLSRYICGNSAPFIACGLPVKFPHRLATLMRRAAKEMPRSFLIYLCLRFNCLWFTHLVAVIYHFLRHREKLDAKNKKLLE